MRISETFRDIQTRIDEAAELIERNGPSSGERTELKQTLQQLSHPADRHFGLFLMMTSQKGRVLAVGPGIDDARAQKIANLQFTADDNHLSEPVRICARCFEHHDSISIVSPMSDGRKMVANVDLEQLLDDVFAQITRGRHAQAALVDGDGEVLFNERTEGGHGDQDLIAGHATLRHTDWKVIVETPRSAIAPEVRSLVEMELYASLGLLLILMLALGAFGFLKYREQSERVERVQALAQTEKLATVGMLGASVAHEIRNIVSVAKLNAELARRSAGLEESTHLDKVADSLERLTDMAENITGYARSDDSETEPFGLDDAVREALELVGPKIDETKLLYETDDNPIIAGNGTALTHVVLNLLLNAYDEVDDQADAEIKISVRKEEGFGVIEVTDNGPGVDPAILDEMFEPFTSTKGEGDEGGTGLGLWLCSEIVDQHSGSIEAENLIRGGARFTVKLPVADETVSADSGAADAEPAPEGDDAPQTSQNYMAS